MPLTNKKKAALITRPNKASYRQLIVELFLQLDRRHSQLLTNDVEQANFATKNMRLVKRSFLVGWLIRNCGYIFILCIVVAFLQAGLYSAHQAHHVEVLPSVDEWLSDENGVSFQDSRKKSAVGDHPIKALMENAEERYKKKVNSQSATLRAAVAEYKRRYGRPPPKGFDKWWAFAKKYDVIMLDEYDAIVEDLEPFWELSGKELRRRTQQVCSLLLYCFTALYMFRSASFPQSTWCASERETYPLLIWSTASKTQRLALELVGLVQC